jgi:hypothetical protein
MSLSVAQNVKPKALINPQLEFSDNGKFGVEIGGIKYNATQTVCQSNAPNGGTYTFNAQPPGIDIAMCRKVIVKWQFTVTLTNSGGTKQGSYLYLGTYDCPRAFPASQCITSCNAQLNGGGLSLNTNQVINGLLRCNLHNHDFKDLSAAPSMLDTVQDYAVPLNRPASNSNYGMIGTVNSPMSSFGNVASYYKCPRGSWEIFNIQEPDINNTTFTFVTYEPLWLAPFDANPKNFGLIGLANFVLSITASNFSRVWCHNNKDTTNGVTLTSVSAILSDYPVLYTTFITPHEAIPIPKVCLYEFTDIIQYNTDTSATNAIPSLSSTSVTTSNVQLTTIPQRILVFVERTQATKTAFTTDTFARIDFVSIQWDNQNGDLSAASGYQLWEMSHDNGYQGEWIDWSRGCGSVLILDVAKNLSLSQIDEAPGMTCNKQLQIKVGFTNINPYDDIFFSVWTVIMYPGVITIEDGGMSKQTGVLSREDVRHAIEEPIHGEMTQAHNYFGSGIKDVTKFFRKSHEFLSKHKPLSKALSAAQHLGYDVHPAFGVASKIASATGYGMRRRRRMHAGRGRKRTRRGGSFLGGAMMNKEELRKKYLESAGDDDDDDDESEEEYEQDDQYMREE